MRDDALRQVLEYIERNLNAEMTLEELASLSGYSLYHFCRLFSQATGESVRGHILKRRLARSIEAVAAGRKAVDAVLEYGFDTYAGFYKAFVRTYGCNPTRYLRIHAAALPASRKWRECPMLSKTELRALLAHWPVDQGLTIQPEPILHGERASDTTFGVGDELVLKLFADRARLVRVLALAEALERQGFHAATPLHTREGAPFFEGMSPLAALVRRVPGQPLPMESYYGPAGLALAREAGRAIARLHRALHTIEPDFPADDANLYDTCANWAMPAQRKQNQQWNLGLSEAFFDDYLSGFGALHASLPRQLIHRDPNPSNVLFDGGAVSGFIDFDLCERNVRLFDPCYCATGILSESGTDEARYRAWPDILGAVLTGYDDVSPLTPEEWRAVYHVVCSIQMIFCAYCAEFEDSVMQKLAATNRNMLVFIAANRARIERNP